MSSSASSASSSSSSSSSGSDRIGAYYSLGKKLSSGAYGVVYLVHPIQSGVARQEIELVAKMASDPECEEVTADLVKEVIAYSMCQHVNIQSLTDLRMDTYGHSLALISPYAKFGNVREFCRTNAAVVVPQHALSLLYQTARALDQIHAKGIAHLDLKPQNLLVFGTNTQPVVKLSDFGACMMSRSYMVKTGPKIEDRLITSWYRPPELWLTNRVGVSSDLWSLGILAFDLLTGCATSVIPCIFSLFYKDAEMKNISEGCFPCLILLHLTGVLKRDLDDAGAYILGNTEFQQYMKKQKHTEVKLMDHKDEEEMHRYTTNNLSILFKHAYNNNRRTQVDELLDSVPTLLEDIARLLLLSPKRRMPAASVLKWECFTTKTWTTHTQEIDRTGLQIQPQTGLECPTRIPLGKDVRTRVMTRLLQLSGRTQSPLIVFLTAVSMVDRTFGNLFRDNVRDDHLLVALTVSYMFLQNESPDSLDHQKAQCMDTKCTSGGLNRILYQLLRETRGCITSDNKMWTAAIGDDPSALTVKRFVIACLLQDSPTPDSVNTIVSPAIFSKFFPTASASNVDPGDLDKQIASAEFFRERPFKMNWDLESVFLYFDPPCASTNIRDLSMKILE